MNVTLIYPPNRNVPGSPYGALPLLAGCLEQHGHKATIYDVNLEVFDRLMKRETVDEFRTTYEEYWDRLRGQTTLRLQDARLLQAMSYWGMTPWERLYEGEYAVQCLRDAQLFGDPEKVNRAYDTIIGILRVMYALNPIHRPSLPGSNDETFGYLANGFDNPISRIIEEHVLDEVLATKPDLVALCIPFNEQAVEGLSFLKQLKDRAPHIKTLSGGAIINGYHETWGPDERFYKYSDFAMPGECEQSFPRFCTLLEEGGDLDELNNLWWRDESGEIHKPRVGYEVSDLNEAATPDFSTVPLGRYLLPYTIANLQTSRGCYYGKCTFCSDYIRGNFRFRKPELVIEDIEKIQEKHGIRHFIFWDPLTSPRFMKAISRWNRTRPEDKRIFWGAETKFEKIFTDQRFTDLLYEGGARFMQFGFESGSQRILDRMVKGNDLSRVHLMMGALRNSKIAISVQWFIGFPGATKEEDRSTYEYLHKHRDAVVLSAYMGKFSLGPDESIFKSNGDMYDIDIFQRPSDGGYDYRYRDTGEEHYDWDEHHDAYIARGDGENITRMAFYIYLTDHPDKVREITQWHRGGAFMDTWEELADEVVALPDANWVKTHDFDIFTPPEQQGLFDGGPVFPKQDCHVLQVHETNRFIQLTNEENALVRKVMEGGHTAAEVVAAVGDTEGNRTALLNAVRRGLLCVPLPKEIASSDESTQQAIAS